MESGGTRITPSKRLHAAMSAAWTAADINLPKCVQKLRGVETLIEPFETLPALQGENPLQIFCFPTITQKTIIANLLKPFRQHVHEVAADKFDMGERDPAFRVFWFLASGRERDVRIGNRKNAVVGNGDFMRVASEVFDGVAKTVESLLEERTPVFLIERVFPSIPNPFFLQFFAGSGKGKCALCVQLRKPGEKFPFELVPQRANRKEKLRRRFFEFAVPCQAAAGNDAMHMNMIAKFLIPSVKDLNDGGDSAKQLRIGRKFE